MSLMSWILVAILVVAYGPPLMLKAAGYLVQKYQFGNSFKETHKYHKEQNELERQHKKEGCTVCLRR